MILPNNTFVREKDATLSVVEEKVIEVSLRNEQIEDFVHYFVPQEGQRNGSSTAIVEKEEKRLGRKFLVHEYYVARSYDAGEIAHNNFRSINKWEGIVDGVYEESFTAVLSDLNNNGAPETVELPLEEVSNQDCSLLRPGAIFYWSIGYETAHGQVKKASIIRFKRLPQWNKKDWDEILDKANELEKGSEWV
jgi:hypothetical protein